MHRVAEDLSVSPFVIHHLWNHYNETGKFTRWIGQGHHCIKTRHGDRYLVISALGHRTVSARQLQQNLRRATGAMVSDQTVRNRLQGSYDPDVLFKCPA